MNYDTAVELMFRAMPDDAPLPPPVVDAGPARRLRDAMEPLSQHSVWSRQVHETYAKLGLDFVTGIVWGRAAALGSPAAAVVVAAFGSWEPGLLTAMYEAGRQACGRAELLAARQSASVESLAAALPDADVAGVAAALRRAVDAADGTGRCLFSGFRALDWPDERVGGLWRACETLRERRGDSHLAAYTAAGVTPLEMHVLSERWLGMPIGSHAGVYGWSEDAITAAVVALEDRGLFGDGDLTAAGKALRDAIEARTDELEEPVVAALGTEFEAIVEALNEWSAACITAGAYPPDPYRRAGG